MLRARGRILWRVAAVVAAVLSFHASGWAAPASEATQKWQDFLAKGDLKSAVIELRNAVHAAPNDPALHARLASIYLRLGDPFNAEREARAARDLHATEPEYLPVLATALIRQAKYDDVISLITPGNREPAFESLLRMLLGTAELDLHELGKAEPMLRDAVRLDPKSLPAKFELAHLLVEKNPTSDEGAKLVDEILAVSPRSVAAIQLKGESAWARGDTDGAMRLFDEALKIVPNFWQTRLKRAQLNIALNHFPAADEDLNPILKIAPKNLQANYLRALEFTKQRKFSQANQILDRIGPYLASDGAYYLQGLVKLMLGQNAQAEALLAKYLARAPDNPAVVQMIAHAALAQGAPSRAIGYVKPLADKAPDASLLATLGDAYEADGKPDLALQQYEKAAEIEPQNPQIQTQLAVGKINTGQLDPGLAGLEKVFETKAGAGVAGPSLVISEVHAGHFDKAAEVASALVKSDPKKPFYQTLLGVVKAAQHDYPGAEAAFRAATDLQPEFGPAVNNLAKLYILMGRRDEAKKAYQDLLDKKPTDPTALLGLAAIAMADQKWDEAIGDLNRARSASPKDPTAGLRLISLYLQRQNWTGAKAVAADLASQFPTNPEILVAQARAQLASGDKATAIGTYRRAYDVAPNSGPILSDYVNLLVGAKDFATAKSVVEAARGHDPKSTPLKIAAIRIDAAANGPDAGVATARAFAKDDPNNNAYDIAAAQILVKAGRAEDALHLVEGAVRANPTDDAARVELAHLYGLGGNDAKAESVLEDRAKAEPNDLAIASALGDLYLAHNKADPAITEYSKVLAKQPGSLSALNNMAFLYQGKGDLAKAREFAERAIAIAPRAGEVEDTLGWILLAQGDTGKALGYLSKAKTDAPLASNIQYHLAVALHRAGKTDDAKALLETLLSSGASFSGKPDAEKLLAELKRG